MVLNVQSRVEIFTLCIDSRSEDSEHNSLIIL